MAKTYFCIWCVALCYKTVYTPFSYIYLHCIAFYYFGFYFTFLSYFNDWCSFHIKRTCGIHSLLFIITILLLDVADQGDPNTNEDGDLAEIDKAAVGRWYGIRKISFMAYLSRDHNSMTHGQLVKFNTVLLNDGNGYNVHTGVFRYNISDNLCLCYSV